MSLAFFDLCHCIITSKRVLSGGSPLHQGMLWNGMENGMEWKENFGIGMEYGRCSEWNRTEDLKNGMEDGLPY